MKKSPLTVRLLIAGGLLMAVSPFWLKELGIALPDFFRGASAGAGIGLEITGFILQRKYNSPCCKSIGKTAE